MLGRSAARDPQEIPVRDRREVTPTRGIHAEGAAAASVGQPGRSQMRRAHSFASCRQRVSCPRQDSNV